ncbi:hypothetical protein CFC21_037371 [Triticum aestivum]|uniref:non-specific serine/threonine protein kinase n=3 Tax=Triticum TaxID=4564 RepID=A0A9R0VQ45_TRITD|nr:probable receptor-like protein kinase At1g11050 [Triticum dicoccoides]XP_044342576.1 probable receptor-like protein kinase At1g11050 [Triticum aestivum]KAF7025142.1 hypothetical protein CFC21_037371 [Triticum aestivum]VAH67219.1 unnamed protein product [Triticum turgidum subsp. durum]
MATVAGLIRLLLVAALALRQAAGEVKPPPPCPLDLGYVRTFPWDRAPCAPPVSNVTACCMTLLSVLGIGLAARLRATGLFRLPSPPASAACIRAFSDALASPPLSLPRSLAPACFPVPSQFAISPSYCAGVTTAAQYVATVGDVAAGELNSSCGSNLTDTSFCYACLAAGIHALARLTAAAGKASNSLNCFYLTALYAAGVSNSAGPTSPATAACAFGLALSTPSPASSNASSSITHTNIAVATVIPIASVLLVSLIALLVWTKRHDGISGRNRGLSDERRPSRQRPNTGSVLFDIRELARATGGFAERNIIGRGGFGVVYRGVLADGSVVAVKKMLDPDVDGGDDEFANEVEIISHFRHRNLVPLRGCCITDADDPDDHGSRQMLLVYDYMPNGSLDRYIFQQQDGAAVMLPWAQRRSVILDVARGLEYMHYGVKPGIYHRDIKATNILLDEDMRARVADFGLARRSRDGQSHLTTRVAGTHGYLSPEYALYGQLTERSDVYSFGVLVLEVMSGRPALDLAEPSGMVLVTDWAWMLVKAGRTREVLAEALLREKECRATVEAMERFVLIGILCAHVTVACRPTMPEALRMLDGDMDVPDLPDRPQPYGQRIPFDEGEGNFSASSVLSGPFLDFGDMLR